MLYIKDSKTLSNFCARIKGESYITFDTEFLRETSYRPELCLIQIAGIKDVAVIDPLTAINLEPLLALFRDKKILKVCHAGRQDLEIFYKLMGELPSPIFDTQIAAMCAGYGENIAYQNLVSDICKIQLKKAMQVTNWKQRPLSAEQIEYAKNDVTYLRVIYEFLANFLKHNKREDWVREELDHLMNLNHYRFSSEMGWKKLKLKRHSPKQLMIAKALAIWREEQANKKNRNRRAILKDEVIYELSVSRPINIKALQKSRYLKYEQIKQIGDSLLKIVKIALDTPQKDWPKLPKHTPISNQNVMLIEGAKLLLKQQAASYGIASKLITSMRELEQYFTDKDAPNLFLRGWREEVFGKIFRDFLSGEVGLRVVKGQLTIESL